MFDDFPDPPIVLSPILAKEPARLGVRRAAWVGIAEKGLYGGQDCGDVVDWRPLVLEDIETDLSIVVNVGVEHFGQETNRGGLVWVVLGEFKG